MAIPLAAIGAGASLLSGGLSAIQGSQASADAARAAQTKQLMLDRLRAMMPAASEMELQLMIPQLVGEYTPEAAEALELGPSAMEDIGVDEQLKLEQLKALAGIGDIAEGGLTEADLAASRQIRRDVGQADQARQQQVLMEMAQRGVLGSGGELAARLGAGQQATERQAAASDELIRQAQARSLQALGQQGNLAGQIRGQEFGEQSDIARARDVIGQFNVRNRQDVLGRNVGERNIAQQQNLQGAQEQANRAAEIKNIEQMRNKQLPAQRYGWEADIMQGRIGAEQQQAQQRQQAHRDTAAGIGQIGQGAIGAISAFGGTGGTK